MWRQMESVNGECKWRLLYSPQLARCVAGESNTIYVNGRPIGCQFPRIHSEVLFKFCVGDIELQAGISIEGCENTVAQTVAL